MDEKTKTSTGRSAVKPKRTAAKAPKAPSTSSAKPLRKAAAAPVARPEKTALPPKSPKPKKPKLVRDSFTIPKEEYEMLATLKQRSAALAHPSKKSELLRAGIKALAAMSDKQLLAAVQAVPSIKTGRPGKARGEI